MKVTRLTEKIDQAERRDAAPGRRLMTQRLAAPDQQISLTDPDSRSMATSGRGSGVVGYNVQAGGHRTPPDRRP